MSQLEDKEWDTEDEDDDEESVPYNPEDIKIYQKRMEIRNIIRDIENDKITLQPFYQRKAVWTKNQNSRLIESILLQIPLPSFYFSEDSYGEWEVLDGQQRLTAIRDYARGDYSLQKLEYLNSANRYCKHEQVAEGCFYSDNEKRIDVCLLKIIERELKATEYKYT